MGVGTRDEEGFGAKIRYLGQWWVVTSQKLLWDVINYECASYLLLVPKSANAILGHQGTYASVNYVIIVWNNGLFGAHVAIPENAELLVIGHMVTNCSGIWIKIHIFSHKMNMKIQAAKRHSFSWPQCVNININYVIDPSPCIKQLCICGI